MVDISEPSDVIYRQGVESSAMLLNNQNRDDLNEWMDKDASDTSPSAPGEFTRIFLGSGAEVVQKPALGDSDAKAFLGRREANEIPQDGSQAGSDLLSNQLQREPCETPKPSNFTKLFEAEALRSQPAPPRPSGLTDFLVTSSTVLPPAPLAAHRLPLTGFSGRAQDVEAQSPRESSLEELSRQFPLRGTADMAHSREKATELFSFEKPTPASMNSPGLPSAFTRVVNSSALRAQEDIVPPTAPPFASAPAAAAPPANIPQFAPMPSPSFPPIPVQAPAPHLYMQGNVLPVQQPAQMPAPMLPAASWHTPSQSVPFPNVASPAQQIEPRLLPEFPGSKWTAYMPLIIALNVLFFLAVIVILIFALLK